jgi:hypothetical protein
MKFATNRRQIPLFLYQNRFKTLPKAALETEVSKRLFNILKNPWGAQGIAAESPQDLH